MEAGAFVALIAIVVARLRTGCPVARQDVMRVTATDGVSPSNGLVWLERNGFITATPDPYSRQHKKFYEPTKRGVRTVAQHFPEDVRRNDDRMGNEILEPRARLLPRLERV